MERYLYELFPNGSVDNGRFQVGDLYGNKGQSLKYNLEKNIWKDFSQKDISGKGFVSIYAAAKGMEFSYAVKELADRFHIKKNPDRTGPPPMDNHTPRELDGATYWTYRDGRGNPIFHICRWEKDGKKQFTPWSWNLDKKEWQRKKPKGKTPLYNLNEVLKSNYICVVEGEKAAEAAKKILPKGLVPTTWAGGANAVENSHWGVLQGKNILLWPDNDEPGRQAMMRVSQIIRDANRITMLNTKMLKEKGDAADLDLGGQNFLSWIKGKTKQIDAILTKDEPEGDDKYPIETRMAQYGVTCDKKGKPIINEASIYAVIEKKYSDFFWYDIFKKVIMTSFKESSPKIIQEEDYTSILMDMQEMGLNTLKSSTVKAAINIFAKRNVKNSAKIWLEDFVWDGERRIDSFFAEYFGAEDSPYVRSCSRNFLISVVARAFEPGCKVDNMIILEGPQGIGKSSGIEAMVPLGWHMAYSGSVRDSKSFYHTIQGMLLVEIAEMGAFNERNIDFMKGMLSSTSDVYDKKYAVNAERSPRVSVFIGSTNKKNYIRDNTGARRFFPVKVRSVDVDRIRNERDQIWAEAVQGYQNGETWWNFPENVESVQNKRIMEDAWTEPISAYLENSLKSYPNGIPRLEIMRVALELTPAMTKEDAPARVDSIMDGLGYARSDYKGQVYFTRRVSLQDGVC